MAVGMSHLCATFRTPMEEKKNMEATSRLEALPEALLAHGILPLLGASDLGRLCCCSRRLNRAAVMDHLWYPLFIIKNNKSNIKGIGDLPSPWQTWHKVFCFKQNTKCIECGEHTPYVFTLLPSLVRLCERCEYTGPKYALVTELEAKRRYVLGDDDLHGLPFKKVKIKKFCVYFFLRSSVEKLSLAKHVQFEGKDHRGKAKHKEEEMIANVVDASCSKVSASFIEADENNGGSNGESENDSSADDTLAKDLSTTVALTGAASSIICLHGLEECSQDMLVQISESAEHVSDRGERKAIRKEHKRQVKAENREKRMRKKLGKNSHQWELSHTESSVKNENTECKLGPRVIGTDLGGMSVEIQNADENINIDGRGKVKKKHWKTKGEHVAASNGGYRQEQFLGYSSQLKTKSPSDWVKQRDWLEAELGRYGISALELAPF